MSSTNSKVEGLDGKIVNVDEIQPYPFTKLTIISYAFLILILGTGILNYLGFNSDTLSILRTIALACLAFSAMYIVRKERPSVEWKTSLGAVFLSPIFIVYFLLNEIIKNSKSGKIKFYVMLSLIFIVGLALFPWIIGFPIIDMFIKLSIANSDLYTMIIWLRYLLSVFLGLIILVLGPIYLMVNGNHPRAEKHSGVIIWTLIIYFLISITYFRWFLFPS